MEWPTEFRAKRNYHKKNSTTMSSSLAQCHGPNTFKTANFFVYDVYISCVKAHMPQYTCECRRTTLGVSPYLPLYLYQAKWP